MDCLRHRKYKSNFKPINIPINDLNKFEKKKINKEESIYRKYLVWLVRLVN